MRQWRAQAVVADGLASLGLGQAHPDTTFDWQGPWSGGYWLPDYLMTLGVVGALFKRGLLVGRKPRFLRITSEGLRVDVTPN
jgi:hypothetical protein